VRQGQGPGCDGPELACNDDIGPGARHSRVNVELQQGQTVIVIVDGFGREGGEFNLTVSSSNTEPTPTATPTVAPPADDPDLAVPEVTGPDSGVAGQVIQVSARITNQSAADARSFEVEFVFSLDETIDASDVRSGIGCVYSRLSAGGEARCAGPVLVPASLSAGSYVLGAIVDLPDAVVESDEDNNGARANGRIEIQAAPTATVTLTPAVSATATRTASASATPVSTVTATETRIVTPTATEAPSPTPTSTRTGTRTASSTPTVTPTRATTPGELPFRICTPTVLSASGSPYVANQSVIIGGPLCSGSSPTVTIDPGVEIRFKSEGGLIVGAGTLVARGTSGAPILFTSGRSDKAPGDWGGIQFQNGAIDAEFDEQGAYVSGSILEHVVVQFAKDAAGGIISALDATPYFKDVVVRDGLAVTPVSPGPGSAAVYATGAGTIRMMDVRIEPFQATYGVLLTGLSSRLSGIRVTNESATAISLSGGTTHDVQGGELVAGGGLSASLTEVTVTSAVVTTVGGGTGMGFGSSTAVVNGSTITGGGAGIACSYGGCTIADSTITGGIGGGIGVSCGFSTCTILDSLVADWTGAGVSMFASNITIRRGIISGNDGSGVQSMAGGVAQIEHSAIVDNGGDGISMCISGFEGNCVTGNGGAGARVCGGSVSVNTFVADLLTCATDTTVAANNFIPDGGIIFETTSLVPLFAEIPGAFWGTTDDQAVEDAITHCADNPALACIVASNLRTDPVPGAPAIEACRNRTFDPRLP
jgi:hypothetical protein